MAEKLKSEEYGIIPKELKIGEYGIIINIVGYERPLYRIPEGECTLENVNQLVSKYIQHWREARRNGQMWAFETPQGMRGYSNPVITEIDHNINPDQIISIVVYRRER